MLLSRRQWNIYLKTAKAIDLFIQSREARGLASSTIRWYAGILNQYAQDYPRLPKSPEDIERFIIRCQGGDERRHGYYRALRCFYRFLNRRRRIRNPVDIVDPPRRLPKYPNILMPDDIDKLLAYPHPPKIKTALLFFIDTGARLGEALSLDIKVLKETPWGFTTTITGKTGMRIVPLNYETYHALMVNLPFNYTEHRLGRKIAQAFKEAGVKGSAITLRHTFATLWEGDELILQQIMGHAHLSTTRIYRHLRTQLVSEQHHKYSPLNMVLSRSKDML